MSALTSYYDYICGRLGFDPAAHRLECVCSSLLVSPFIAVLSDDENQVEQVLYMRREFVRGLSEAEKKAFYRSLGPCSVLEILVIFVEKMRYNLIGNPLASSDPGALFLELLDNLGLSWINDDAFGADPDGCNDAIEDILQTFTYRDYDADGQNGGLFPLDFPKNDVREMSLFRQMESYLIEKYDLLE